MCAKSVVNASQKETMGETINILVIEDNDFDKAFLKTCLDDDGQSRYNLVFVSAITVAIMRAKFEKFDLILLDFHLPDGTAPEFITNFKDVIDVPIIVLTGYKLRKIESLVLSAGASDYIPKDNLNEELLKRAIRFSLERHRELQKIKDQAMIDPLTGCYVRSTLDKLFKNHVKRSIKKNLKSALIMIGFDDLKTINENYGHSLGDEALKCVALTLKGFASDREDKDFVIRFGGNKFIYLSTDFEDVTQISALADRFVEQHSKQFVIKAENIALPLNIGIALYEDDGEDLDSLMRNAKEALNKAKEAQGSAYEIMT